MQYFSKSIIALLLIVWIWTCFNLSLWKSDRTIEGDVFSYYAYLPALFIKHDIKLSFLNTDKQSYFNNLWYSTAPNGNRFTKMGIGTAILYSPFFFIAHGCAYLFNFPTDGFSYPYKMCLIFSSIFYALLGIIFLRKILLKYFSDVVTGITLLSIVLGTNLLCYTTLSPLMSHAYSFFLFSVFLYLTFKWYNKVQTITSLLLGIVAGLIIITRPSNIIIVLIFLLFGIKNFRDGYNKINFYITNLKQLTIIAIAAFIAMMPKLFYWKYVTEHWIFYSYTDEHFYFSHPHIIEGLFGYRKGWLLYTPMMLLAIVGLFALRKKIPQIFLPTVLFLILNIYIILSWWSWWYGGGFGGRTFIESYALLAFPFASFISFFTNKKMFIKIIMGTLIFFFISLNCFQTYQHKSSLLHWDSMTKEAYWAIFGGLKFPKNYDKLIKTPDYENAKKYGEEK